VAEVIACKKASRRVSPAFCSGPPRASLAPTPRAIGFRTLPRDLVAQPDDAVGVLPGGEQAQRHVPVARRDERDALADEDGDDVDVELVDLAGVEK
jgi:hypothetical protein